MFRPRVTASLPLQKRDTKRRRRRRRRRRCCRKEGGGQHYSNYSSFY
jgi:hypothetical protein